MKKKLSYRDKLVELAYIYDVKEIKDYENYEFRSPVNPWDVQANYKADFSKFKTLDVVLTPGKVFYLPPYWWYSIRFDELSSISFLHYDT